MSRSYDGGLTWSGAFLPGFKLDTSAASLASPVYGMEAASDPVVAAGPCGMIYVGFVAFVRGGSSAMAVARFEDLNDSEQGETFVYKGTTIIESAHNATNGYFLDKPALAVDISRPSNGCGQTVYLTYTTFNGLGKDGKFQSSVYVARSTDAGRTFTTEKINGSFGENQGTTIGIDPLSGDVNVFWRHFFSPDTIVHTQLNAANGRWSKPVSIIPDVLQPFDQPSLATTLFADPASGIAFRSNGFPAAAVARDGTILVAWQERVNPATGLPAAGGSPRIVMTSRGAKSTSWTARKAIDNGPRTSDGDGLGYFFSVGRSDTAAHPQVMPSLACIGGSCLLTYYESRTASLTGGTFPGWVGGYSRVLDLRGALVTPNLTVARSFQISRYPYKAGSTEESLVGIDEAAPGVPRLNFVNYPTSGGGTTPFIGDYTAVIPAVAFVADGNGGFRHPINDGDLPYIGFRAAWSDNRNLVPPAGGIDDFKNYAPPNAAACGPNVGSRNTDILTSTISLGLLVTAPVTTKTSPTPPDVLIEFPMTVWNNTGQQRSFTLTIDQNAGAASFSKTDPAPVTSGVVTIYPYSSVTKVVYVANTLTTHVSVAEQAGAGSLGLKGGITFNGAWSNPAPAPVLQPAVLAVSDPANPIPQNPIPQNPIPQNPIPQNPIPQNFGITDTTWTVTATGDPTRAYLALLSVDKAYANDYAFQLIITKPSAIATCVNGSAVNLSQGTLIANVWDPSNPIPQNPIPQNPIPQNSGFPDSTLAQNSTFIVAPANVAAAAGAARVAAQTAASVSCPDADGDYRLDACTGAAPRAAEIVNITLRAYQKTPTPARLWTPDVLPPSLVVSDYWCDGTTPGATNCTIVEKGPDLAAPSSATANPASVSTGGTVTFPAAALTIPNRGTLPAETRRYGFYLSSSSTLPLLGNGTVDLTKATLLDSIAFSSPLAAGAADVIEPRTLTIPGGTSAGSYFLYLYADDQRIVSELSEENNIASAALSVVTPPADLVVPGAVPPAGTVNAGATVTFPAVTVTNAGSSNSGPWRYRYFLASTATLDPSTATALTAALAGPASLGAGATFVVPQRSLTIPTTVAVDPATGLANYNIFLFVDSDQTVAELDETNNVTAMSLVVSKTPPYGFSGLQSPCSGLSCTGGAGSSNPLAWQFLKNGVAVDSPNALPEIWIYKSSCTTWAQGALLSDGTPEDPGTSSFQYPVNNRPAFTWQFNWKDPKAKAGCYLVYIGSRATGQTLPNGTPFGPIRFTLK